MGQKPDDTEKQQNGPKAQKMKEAAAAGRKKPKGLKIDFGLFKSKK